MQLVRWRRLRPRQKGWREALVSVRVQVECARVAVPAWGEDCAIRGVCRRGEEDRDGGGGREEEERAEGG